jgi:4-hydroxyphenylpyruvate dioxygenase
LLEQTDFSQIPEDRSKDVALYRQGNVNFNVNREPKSLAGYLAVERCPCACIMVLRVKEERQAYA